VGRRGRERNGVQGRAGRGCERFIRARFSELNFSSLIRFVQILTISRCSFVSARQESDEEWGIEDIFSTTRRPGLCSSRRVYWSYRELSHSLDCYLVILINYFACLRPFSKYLICPSSLFPRRDEPLAVFTDTRI